MTPGITVVRDDILQVQIPLPYALNIVNCYLLRGRGGWTLLDTGLNTAGARAMWQSAMIALDFRPGDIEKIVLTHTHPDHFGMAGWWQRQTREPIPLYIPSGEMAQARILYQGENIDEVDQWLLDCGMDSATVDAVRVAVNSTRNLTRPHPTSWRCLDADRDVQLGERSFRAIHAPGHSDGQLIFYDKEERLMLCGDHVLMRITPNIGSWPHTLPDPLGRYLESLRELAELDVQLALPGHKALIHDWRGRIEELLAHHDLRLQQTLAALDKGANTVYEVSAHLFQLDRLTPHEWRFAMAEALAHLHNLQARGQAACGGDGVMRWHAR